jgi:putative ABC transport system permease protein
VRQDPALSRAITAVAGQSFIPVEARQPGPGEGTFEGYPLRGVDDTFLQKSTYGFAARARGYRSDREVWQAMGTTPGLAVVDAMVAPHRGNFGFGVLPKFRLRGMYVEDKVFDPVPVDVRDPQTGTVTRVTVIGVLGDTVPYAMAGISTSQRTLAPFGSRATPSAYYFSVAKGVDGVAQAKRLESVFLANGMQAKAMSELLSDAVSSSLTFQWLILGFLGLGLIIGVAALGVISTRAVVERRQQIGVLRAIGFQRRMVQLSFLLESTFVTGIGIVVGSALGLAVAYNVVADSARQPSWDNLTFAPPWAALAGILAVVFLASLATTLAPARRASRIYPADALRYE